MRFFAGFFDTLLSFTEQRKGGGTEAESTKAGSAEVGSAEAGSTKARKYGSICSGNRRENR